MAVVPIISQSWDTTSYFNPTRMNNIETNIGIVSKATGVEYSSGVSVKDKLDGMIESGSNANGNWIKYADGNMICYKSIPFKNLTINNAWGVLYESALLDLGDFPQTFYSAPYVNGSVVNGNAWLETVPRTSPSNIGQTRVVRPTTATIDFDIHIIAIGRWKA